MTNTGIAIMVAAVVLAAPALAGEPKISAAYGACMDAPQATTAAMRECMAAEAKRWDARLNRAYKAVLSRLGERSKKKQELIELQRLWLTYRQAKCGFFADLTGGTIDILAAGSCWLDTAAHRTLELESLLEP